QVHHIRQRQAHTERVPRQRASVSVFDCARGLFTGESRPCAPKQRERLPVPVLRRRRVGGEYTESTLHHRDGEWYLHLGHRKQKPEQEVPTQNGTVRFGSVLGVDLGVNQIGLPSLARHALSVQASSAQSRPQRVRENAWPWRPPRVWHAISSPHAATTEWSGRRVREARVTLGGKRDCRRSR
ncbi:MAG: hypothetical protein J07HQW2_02498, partial [Haloquadratum walsbyi J07HQW2]